MKESRCQQIEKILRQRLRGMRHDEKIPTEMELCAEFSVSRMTMNKVIAKLVRDDLLYRVKKKGTFIKERRIPEKPIYFLLPVVDYLAYDVTRSARQILCGLNAEASLSDRKIEFLPVTRTNRIDDYDWEALEKISCGDQVFISGFWYKKLFPFLKKKDCDVVCLNPDIWIEDEYREILSTWYSIKIARKAGAENAVDYLAKNGKKNPLLLYQYDEKEHPATEGFKSGLKKSGLPFSRERFIHMDNLKKTCDRLKNIHKKILFDSIVISSAVAVKDICRELSNMKLKMPDDICVITLEEAPFLREMAVPVSAMASPFSEVGRETARIFEREIFLPGETRLHQLLIERESTRKGAGNALNIEFMPETKIPEALLRFGTDGI